MPPKRPISSEKAARIAKSVACPNCQEYSFKKVTARLASQSHRTTLKAHWVVTRHCGICGQEQDLGLDAAGEVVFGE